MVEEQKRRLEGAIGDMIEDMYRSHLRRMQSIMHRCAAKCCDDDRGTLDSVQRCIEKCATPLMDAQDYLQNELGQFQSQLQNCVKDCNTDARSKMGDNPNERDMSRTKHLFEVCTGGCVDKHINMLPGLLRNIQKTFDRGVPKRSLMREQKNLDS